MHRKLFLGSCWVWVVVIIYLLNLRLLFDVEDELLYGDCVWRSRIVAIATAWNAVAFGSRGFESHLLRNSNKGYFL